MTRILLVIVTAVASCDQPRAAKQTKGTQSIILKAGQALHGGRRTVTHDGDQRDRRSATTSAASA
jgi:hypothetical protein